MKNLFGLVFITLILVSCGTTENKMIETVKNPVHKKWELSVLNGQPVMENSPIYIELTADEKVSGFAGCNRLTGSYNIENESQIKFSKLANTKMACPEMDMENKVLKMLNTTDNFTLNDGKLMLNVGRRAALATFIEMSDNEIVNKYWKLKKLGGKPVEMAKNQEREQYFTLRSDNSVFGFAGCNRFNGTYELSEGNRINFNENMITTMKACLDLKVDESAFLKMLQLTDNYTINGDTLNLNVGKRAPLAVFEAVYLY